MVLGDILHIYACLVNTFLLFTGGQFNCTVAIIHYPPSRSIREPSKTHSRSNRSSALLQFHFSRIQEYRFPLQIRHFHTVQLLYTHWLITDRMQNSQEPFTDYINFSALIRIKVKSTLCADFQETTGSENSQFSTINSVVSSLISYFSQVSQAPPRGGISRA